MLECEWCADWIYNTYRVIAQLDKENKIYEYVCETCLDITLSLRH